MATYGDFPGVKILTKGGGLTGVEVGAEEKLLVFGQGDPSNGSASTNDPTRVASQNDADNKFGAGSELAEAMKLALGNGANRDFLYGVMLSSPSSTTQTVAASQDHTGSSKLTAPLHEDLSTVTVAEDTSGDGVYDTGLTVEFRYETNTDDTSSDFTSNPPSNADTVFINPLTGEWVADSSGDYEFQHETLDFGTALESADRIVNEGETGVYAALSEAPDVHSSLTSKVNSLRNNFQFVQGLAGARPNATDSDTGNAQYDAFTYSDNTDDDAMFLVAPARQLGSQSTIIGAVGGLMAGHPITDPIYNDVLSELDNLEQKLTGSDADDLRAEQVIPVRQAGSIRLKANRSTSTETDWERDFWRRRIVDRVILVTKKVGDDTVGRINDGDTQEDAENVIFGELSSMVDNRLLKPNEGGEERWFVRVTQDPDDSDLVNINIGITPQGVVKRIDETITIST